MASTGGSKYRGRELAGRSSKWIGSGTDAHRSGVIALALGAGATSANFVLRNHGAQQTVTLTQTTTGASVVTHLTTTTRTVSQVPGTATKTVTTTLSKATITTTKTATSLSTTSIYPPSNSSYALGFVSGTVTSTQPVCGAFNYTLNVTFEKHASIPSTVILWVQFPTGAVSRVSDQNVFTSQADMIVYGKASYQFTTCGSSFATLAVFVTSSANAVLSPTVSLTVSNQ